MRRIVIVGRDAPAWIAALSLQRALGPSGVIVSVVELPSLLTVTDVYAALPSLHSLHALIGLDEGAVLTAAAGVPMVAQHYSGWNGDSSFLQGYDTAEAPGAFLSFAQLWARARSKGLRVGFEDFSFGAMAARLGRVPSESDDPAALGATYGYHLDAGAYSALLRAMAVRRGVNILGGGLRSVAVDGERIRAVELASGERVEAGLFVDASGPEAALISRLAGDRFESWARYLPCDRLLTASAPALSPPPAFSQVMAFENGWIGMYPLQDRTALVAAFRSSDMSPNQIVDRLRLVAPGGIQGQAIVSAINPGIRPTPWIGNCVAIGEAAASLEPLDALSLQVAHMCVSQLITFFPVAEDMALEAEEYSSAIRLQAGHLRDFQCAHYKLNGRFGEPFWDAARAAPVSDELARKIAIFSARGLPVSYDDEAFEAHSWATMFIGHGVVPAEQDPRAELIPEENLLQDIQGRLREIGATVPTLPNVDSFLSATCIPLESPAAS